MQIKRAFPCGESNFYRSQKNTSKLWTFVLKFSCLVPYYASRPSKIVLIHGYRDQYFQVACKSLTCGCFSNSHLPMSYVKGTSSCFLALKSCISCFQVPAVRYCNEQSSFYQASAVLIQICADQYYLCLIFGDALSLAKRQSIAEDQASVVLIRTNLNQYRRRSVEWRLLVTRIGLFDNKSIGLFDSKRIGLFDNKRVL